MRAFLTRFSACDPDMRPGIRWWLPGAKLDDRELIRELEDMHRAGIGAVELSCQNQNGDGWGSPQWFSHFKVILREARKRNMKVDFMPGVHWVTTAIGLELYGSGSEKELVQCSDTKTLPRAPIRWSIPAPLPRPGGNGNHDFDRRVPVEQGIFLGAVIRNPATGDIVFQMEGTDGWISLTSTPALFLEWTPPSEGEWELLSFWELPTGILVRGNSAIDHFHPDGTGAVIAWWNRTLEQDPELKQLIRDYARYLFLDSLELGTKRLWSHGMLPEFRRRRGYDLLPELPRLFSDAPEDAALQRDYDQVLTELLRENYFSAFSRWCEANRLRLRAQSCYGIHSEMAQVSTAIHCPETERLGFTDSIDGYRNQAGTVHVQNKPVYSAELAPVLGAGYRQTWRQLLFHTYRCFVSGVNYAVWHGYAYRTDLEDSREQWPGYSPMTPLFGEELGSRIPSWQYCRAANDAITRQQTFLQYGTAKVDLAVYHHSYYENNLAPDYSMEDTLETHGYSLDYLSPSLMQPELEVKDGMLLPNGPGYRGILLLNQQTISLHGVRCLTRYAQKGLPILIVGAVPSRSPFARETGIDRAMQQLLAQENVHQLAGLQDAVNLLSRLNILPAAMPKAPTGLLCAHRANHCGDYYYLLAQEKQAGNQKTTLPRNAIHTELTLKGTGSVYRLDPWTGKAFILPTLHAEPGSVTVMLHLNGNDAALLMVTEEPVEAEPLPVFRRQQQLSHWDLTLTTWQPASESHLETEKAACTFHHTPLLSWETLMGQPCSGTGVYTTDFFAEQSAPYALELGQVSDCYQVFLNGQIVPGGNVVTPQLLLSNVRQGHNHLEIRVGSNLYGVMQKHNRTCEALFGNHLPPMPGVQAAELNTDAGLLGPVVLHTT